MPTSEMSESLTDQCTLYQLNCCLQYWLLQKCFETQENIATTDLLVSLPLELIITDKSSPCAAVRQLRNELQRGKCSFYWPYLKTLHGAHISVPDVWSFEERSLLDGLPTPRGGWQSYSAKYFTDCLDTNADALTLHALMLYHTRAGPFGRLAFRGI